MKLKIGEVCPYSEETITKDYCFYCTDNAPEEDKYVDCRKANHDCDFCAHSKQNNGTGRFCEKVCNGDEMHKFSKKYKHLIYPGEDEIIEF